MRVSGRSSGRATVTRRLRASNNDRSDMTRKPNTLTNDREATTPDAEGAKRPRVICHMMASIDGRIVTDGWPVSDEGWQQYEEVHDGYEADGWLCGRVTMEQHFAIGVRAEEELARQHGGGPGEDFVAPGEHESFAFALDPRGRLLWGSADLDGDHIVAILSERVS